MTSDGMEGEHAAGVCRLFLVRHGTTALGAKNRYRGRRDIPLDATGYQDAVDVARRLSGAGLAAVYTGPLRRTMSAAQIIADHAGVPDLRILRGLNNVDYGAWEGMTADEAAAFNPEAFDLYRRCPERAECPQGERLGDAQQRMMGTLRLIASRHAGETVVTVTHAVMIRLVLVRLGVVEDERWRRPEGHGPVTELHAQRGRIWLADPVRANGYAVPVQVNGQAVSSAARLFRAAVQPR
jgi:broad specificity phosphatase PhoE